jgi:hypothetical protein
LYCHNIDVLYFQGKTNVTNGEEDLAYKEKYNYISPDAMKELLENESIYIVSEEYLDIFPVDMYHLTKFNDFYVAIPK